MGDTRRGLGILALLILMLAIWLESFGGQLTRLYNRSGGNKRACKVSSSLLPLLPFLVIFIEVFGKQIRARKFPYERKPSDLGVVHLKFPIPGGV